MLKMVCDTSVMSPTQKSMSFDDATFPASSEAAPDVFAWQTDKIKAGLKEADEGKFASTEDIKAVIQKYLPNG